MTDLQKRILSIYKDFKKLCDEHGLRYFATGGTAIGAARHAGFIPWDDDIDIDMPWPDYVEFLKIAKKELPGNLVLQNGMEQGSVFIFSKVHEKNSTYFVEEIVNSPSAYTGVYIDIFPMIGMPSGDKAQARHEDLSIDAIRGIWKKRVLGRGDNERELLEEYRAVCERYPYDEAKYIRRGATWMREQALYPAHWYDGFVELPFEDTTIRMPKEYHKQLSVRFGDYMKLPPKAERVSHGEVSLLDFNRSYKDYATLVDSKDPIMANYTGLINQTLVSKRNAQYNTTEDNQQLRQEIGRLTEEIAGLNELVLSLRSESEINKEKLEQMSGIRVSGRLFLANIKRRVGRILHEK